MKSLKEYLRWGHLVVLITVDHPEQWLNELLKKGIKVWDIKRPGQKSLELCINIQDFRDIRPFLKQTHTRIHILKKHGLAFMLVQLFKRKGFLFGAFLAVIVIFMLSNLLFNIEIKGADPELELKINEILNKKGIHLGVFTPMMDENAMLEKELSQSLKNVTWVGVSRNGTSLKIQVVQKNLPKKEKEVGPGNVIATKKAMVKSIYAEKGQAVVRENQWVNQGDVLITGQIGSEDKPKWVAAKGSIIGETWYRSTVEIPVSRSIKQVKPDGHYRLQFVFFHLPIPIWYSGTGVKSPKLCHTNTSDFYFLNWKLPFEIKHIQCYKTINKSVTYTAATAKKLAENLSSKQLLNTLPSKSKILSRDLDKTVTDKGKWTFYFHYVIEENIGKRQSFGPG